MKVLLSTLILSYAFTSPVYASNNSKNVLYTCNQAALATGYTKENMIKLTLPFGLIEKTEGEEDFETTKILDAALSFYDLPVKVNIGEAMTLTLRLLNSSDLSSADFALNNLLNIGGVSASCVYETRN